MLVVMSGHAFCRGGRSHATYGPPFLTIAVLFQNAAAEQRSSSSERPRQNRGAPRRETRDDEGLLGLPTRRPRELLLLEDGEGDGVQETEGDEAALQAEGGDEEDAGLWADEKRHAGVQGDEPQGAQDDKVNGKKVDLSVREFPLEMPICGITQPSAPPC